MGSVAPTNPLGTELGSVHPEEQWLCPILVPPPSPSNTPAHTEFVAEGPASALASDDSAILGQ